MAHETPYSPSLQCFIFLLFLMPLIALGIVLMVLYVPHPPKFQVISFEVSPIILTPLDDKSTLLSATWNLTFIARNPNKRLQLHYKDVGVSLYYQWVNLSSQRLGFFMQKEKNENVVHACVVTKSLVLSNQILAAMEKDAREDLAVNFIVKLRGNVRVYIGRSLMGVDHALSIDCDDVRVVFSPQNGTGLMLDGSRKCFSTGLLF